MSLWELEARPAPLIPRLVALRRAWLAMDADPAARAFAGTAGGMALIHGGFLLALALSLQVSGPALALVAITLAAAALRPDRRLAILLVASLAFLFLRPFRTADFARLVADLAAGPAFSGAVHPLMLQFAAVIAFLAFAQALAFGQRAGAGPLARRPVLAQGAGFMALLALAAFMEPGGPAHAAVWAFLAVWASCFWFLAYAAADRKAKAAQPDAVRALYMRPVWGGDVAPMGKGLSFLARFEAKDDDALAAARLKGLKLAVWAAILSWVMMAATALLHDRLGVPRLGAMILDPAAAEAIPLAWRWAGLIANYGIDLLTIAAWGHAIVAVVRMMGYGIPRNTVNPLASRSLAEFWNRYYYYFKEVLVDFFFYPAFTRWFKASPRLRIAFATFCAAGLGNFFYHLVFASHVFAGGAPFDELDRFATLAFYVTALSAGLIASQLFGRKTAPEDGFWRHEVLPRLRVGLFFCFLKIFDSLWLQGTLWDRFVFLSGLFGA